jgi:hypothetical protein
MRVAPFLKLAGEAWWAGRRRGGAAQGVGGPEYPTQTPRSEEDLEETSLTHMLREIPSPEPGSALA